MQILPRRTSLGGPALTRLLARLTDADVSASGQSIPDRLSQWLGWTDAIALSAALKGAPPAVQGGARPTDAEEDECARVRAALTGAIAGDGASSGRARRRMPARGDGAAAPAAIEYASYRQRHAYLQQTMETSIRNLRARLRTALASHTPEMTRLAVVDAVMEQALGPREHHLLAGIPALLEGHFERLRLAGQDAAAGDAAPASPAWLDTFRRDMQSVLLAELEIRMQPVEGLLAALRACPPRTS